MDPRLGSAVATSNAAPSPASQESAKETAQQVTTDFVTPYPIISLTYTLVYNPTPYH